MSPTVVLWVLNQFGHNSENEVSALFFPPLLCCLYEKKCAYILTPWHFFCCDSFWWDGNAVWRRILSYVSLENCSAISALRSGHLGAKRFQILSRGLSCNLEFTPVRKQSKRKTKIQSLSRKRHIICTEYSHILPSKDMNAATGGNLLSLWMFSGWL